MPHVLDPHDPLSSFPVDRILYGALGSARGDPCCGVTIEDIFEAAAAVDVLDERGWQLIMVVSDAAQPVLAVRASPLPPASMTSPKLWDVDRRFRTNERFARALFGVLDVAGRVYAARPARGFKLIYPVADSGSGSASGSGFTPAAVPE